MRASWVVASSLLILFKTSLLNGLSHITRRAWLTASSAAVSSAVLSCATGSSAVAKSSAPDKPVPSIEPIKDAQETLGKLLENWKTATVDCTFADVPRELLEAKNKELLLEKASTFALFDKSVSVETCKTTNRIVRDYLGATGKGPLVGIDKKIRIALDLLEDPDRLDEYVTASEAFSQALAKATSLAYAAGQDFDSQNNFEKGDSDRNDNSNLEQSRRAIEEAKKAIDGIVGMLQSG
eukprot:CAMPEP_0194029894 /NCGR_PEP_ID=MMETSP0009_2-20130614/3528_1 /TAXON_ID=210454 /ORGANISM="Grammatophora oceanica, Strain CCMP 410" /LENGTH=237 /DNA_ID=CAMNT_0038669713 /DNA_START=57 /DNA_END=770 /DNA_ORIENTATION=+